MKKLFLAAALALASGFAFSQSPLPVGKAQLNLGLGLSAWGVPIYAGIDYGIHKDITIGGEFAYRSYSENFRDISYSHNIISILANGNYHFNTVLNIPDKWDFYAGLNLGFYDWSSPGGYTGSHSSGLGLGAQIGGRYYLSNKVGLNLEFGGGNVVSDGKIGVTIKF
jgi:outer membrane immunogenic protein